MLKSATARLIAAAWDCGATLGLATIAFVVLGTFWTSFAFVAIALLVAKVPEI